MTIEVEEILAAYEPEEAARILESWNRVVVKWLPRATLAQRLSGLKLEERLSGLKPEERLSGLKPEERLSGLKPEERLAGLTPEERLALLKQLSASLDDPAKKDQ